MQVLNFFLSINIIVVGGGIIIGDNDIMSENEVQTSNFPFVTRSEWRARDPKQKTPLKTPVPYVVIHHSFTPPACYSHFECCQAMRSMQNFHMDDRGWWDIGYNFAVGSDGVVYEGRGWNILGAHALHFNKISIGICLIGDWTNILPPKEQLKTAKSLIASGVDLGWVRPDYKLVGHRQVRDTKCPGDVFFQDIHHWPHFSEFPASVKDLIHVEELKGKIDLSKLNCTKVYHHVTP